MFNGLSTFVLFLTFAREDLYLDDHTLNARGCDQGGISDITSLFSKDRSQELFFRGQLRFPLRSDLADQNVSRPYARTDPNHTTLIQISEETLTDIRNVARD